MVFSQKTNARVKPRPTQFNNKNNDNIYPNCWGWLHGSISPFRSIIGHLLSQTMPTTFLLTSSTRVPSLDCRSGQPLIALLYTLQNEKQNMREDWGFTNVIFWTPSNPFCYLGYLNLQDINIRHENIRQGMIWHRHGDTTTLNTGIWLRTKQQIKVF